VYVGSPAVFKAHYKVQSMGILVDSGHVPRKFNENACSEIESCILRQKIALLRSGSGSLL